MRPIQADDGGYYYADDSSGYLYTLGDEGYNLIGNYNKPDSYYNRFKPAVSTPALPKTDNFLGVDWSTATHGVPITIGDTMYIPQRGYVIESEASSGYEGPLEKILSQKVGARPGETRQILDPTGKVLGYDAVEDPSSSGFFEDLFDTSFGLAKEMAPLATFAVGAGPLAGMLGGAAASTLGISGLSAAQTAALGSAITGGANTALQGGGIEDVLKSAVMTAAPSFVIPQIPTTGTPAVDAAIKAATQTAIRGGDIGSAVAGSLLNSGFSGITGDLGLDPKLVNFGIQAAQSGGDPNKIFNAITKLGPVLDNTSTGGYGGAETSGFFDAEEAQAVQDDIASLLARYPEAKPSFFPEFDAPLLTAEPPAPTPAPSPSFTLPSDEVYEDIENLLIRYPDADLGSKEAPSTNMDPRELNQFLEANIEDPATVEQLMQDYFPELYRQQIEVTGTPAKPELFPEFDQPLLTAEPTTPAPTPTAAPAPTPPSAPGPSAAPGPSPSPSPAPSPSTAQSGMDLSGLFAFMGMMNQDEDKPDLYQVAQINTPSPFGTIYDQQQDLLGLMGRG